ncbi:TRAP transporter small permease subunit [Pseudodonghicola sp.]|uniref:TRAP transporter small permease subunit n=1 Tax=Pseudodonghicola sp. TaxID=1969463 RepID=UPI003A985492
MFRVSHALTLVQNAVLALSALALFALPLITAYDVALRYLFHAPTIWATEISIYLLQFAVFMTPGALLAGGNHLRVTFWIETRTGLTRRIAETVTALAVLPYAAILIWFGTSYALRAFDRGMLSPTLLQVPLWIVYALIPLGGALLVLGVLLRGLTIWTDQMKPEARA